MAAGWRRILPGRGRSPISSPASAPSRCARARAPVTAVESNQRRSMRWVPRARRASGLKPIATERRDLFAHPALAGELNAFDGVVFDPPRAGAKAQAAALAASKVQLVAAVSCNPATLRPRRPHAYRRRLPARARRAGRPVRLFGGDGNRGVVCASEPSVEAITAPTTLILKARVSEAKEPRRMTPASAG